MGNKLFGGERVYDLGVLSVFPFFCQLILSGFLRRGGGTTLSNV